jgi:RNA polymerase sigma factor (sigma-70 family)
MVDIVETDGAPAASTAGAVAQLYVEHAKRLEQIVRVDVHAPEALVEDACQFAWSRLVFHAHRVRRETVLPWLVTTAVRHAFKLLRRERRLLSLEALVEQAAEPVSPLPSPDEVAEERQRLVDLDRLPERQQRLVWLQGLGLSYVEMAEREGCTTRTVERQLLRARRTMRATALG